MPDVLLMSCSFLSEAGAFELSSAHQNEMWDKGIIGRAKFLHSFCASQDPERLHAQSQPDIFVLHAWLSQLGPHPSFLVSPRVPCIIVPAICVTRWDYLL